VVFFIHTSNFNSFPVENTVKETARTSILQAQLRQHKSDKLALKNALSRQTEIEKKLKIALENFAILEREYKETEAEHKQLYDSFESNILEVKRQSNELNSTLQLRLKLETKPSVQPPKQVCLNQISDEFLDDPSIQSASSKESNGNL